MNAILLIGEFLKSNYDGHYRLRNSDSSNEMWCEIHQSRVKKGNWYQPGRRLTIGTWKRRVEEESVKMWFFKNQFETVGELVVELDIANPNFFQTITQVISDKLELEPLCQPLKAKTSTK
jgi:hypothetical protein